MATQRYTAKEVAEALQKNNGVIRAAANTLGCSRKTVYNYVKRYKTVQEAKQSARESTKDLAEIRLIEAIADGEPWAIKYYLNANATDRGYGKQRIEQSGPDGGPIEVEEQAVKQRLKEALSDWSLVEDGESRGR